ncbi:AraC family transcriptional regulator [Pseudomonas sp. TH41]|uniref:AraC family transcriptional regulator n=1 Tax=Pseudomonas sp. TH41 TaxID=2796405 RepID=UPI001911F81A|nr:AraC family transcriptional regulator [Pseudomonas sp. TH41]MBK5356096.1 AraC family transcriptional regulator [Pseudomonas sp. TH41]
MPNLKPPASPIDADAVPISGIGEPTIFAGYGQAISKALESSGVDSGRIFRAVGIPPVFSNDPMSRLPREAMTRLYRVCVDATNNPYFGLMVAKYLHPTNLHALGYALVASATLMDVCQRLERYMRLLTQAPKVSVTETDGQVLLRFEYLTEVCSEAEDSFIGFLLLLMRNLYKPNFNPARVEFCHAMPLGGAAPYEALIRAPVLFAQTDSLLVFDSADMHQSLGGSCPDLAQINDTIAIGFLARLDKSDVITGVKQKIIEFLPDGDCGRDKVAKALRMTPLTLHSKLAQRGTTFQQLFENTRKELACSYLEKGQSERSVTEITFLLGFTDTSNFTRAFKRWTGMSPTDFRHQDKSLAGD